jgi:hypothetical protein
MATNETSIRGLAVGREIEVFRLQLRDTVLDSEDAPSESQDGSSAVTEAHYDDAGNGTFSNMSNGEILSTTPTEVSVPLPELQPKRPLQNESSYSSDSRRVVLVTRPSQR